jgi:hypothetical protein
MRVVHLKEKKTELLNGAVNFGLITSEDKELIEKSLDSVKNSEIIVSLSFFNEFQDTDFIKRSWIIRNKLIKKGADDFQRLVVSLDQKLQGNPRKDFIRFFQALYIEKYLERDKTKTKAKIYQLHYS